MSNTAQNYNRETWAPFEQEQFWHGVPLSELNELAKRTYRGEYVTIDKYGFLVFHYSSKSRKTSLSAQCELDENGYLKRVPHNYYPGQCRDSADEFVELVNEQIIFRQKEIF